ncbi:MAG: hypothetical protein IKO60_00200, partial [Bacteroidaceae bacterium]|nr:hypothetical protein [Bacteroidaceae bacterium]
IFRFSHRGKDEADRRPNPYRQEASAHAPRSIGLRSTEHRLTLHGASAHTPRCIGSHSTEHQILAL